MIIELVRLLKERGALEGAPAAATLPSGARATIERRLDRLPGGCLEILARAAVLGRSFQADLLARSAIVRSAATLLGALDEAASAHVIEQEAPVGTYRFGHALLREVVYARLSSSERVQLHCRAGRALEQRHAASQNPPLAALVHHFTQSPFHERRHEGDRLRGARSDDAMRMLAYPEAIELYRRAREPGAHGAGDDARIAPLAASAGARAASARAGTPMRSRTYRRLIAQARASRTRALRAGGAVGLEEARYTARAPRSSSIPLLEEALRGCKLPRRCARRC